MRKWGRKAVRISSGKVNNTKATIFPRDIPGRASSSELKAAACMSGRSTKAMSHVAAESPSEVIFMTCAPQRSPKRVRSVRNPPGFATTARRIPEIFGGAGRAMLVSYAKPSALIVNVKVDPTSTSLSRPISPPINSTKVRLITKPNPVPP